MIRWIAGAAVGIACVGFGIHAYYRYEEREAAVQEMEARGQQENEDAEDQKNGILTWNGKKYRRNTAMRAILCMRRYSGWKRRRCRCHLSDRRGRVQRSGSDCTDSKKYNDGDRGI